VTVISGRILFRRMYRVRPTSSKTGFIGIGSYLDATENLACESGADSGRRVSSGCLMESLNHRRDSAGPSRPSFVDQTSNSGYDEPRCRCGSIRTLRISSHLHSGIDFFVSTSLRIQPGFNPWSEEPNCNPMVPRFERDRVGPRAD
jgi:hypothetical protein